jgi:hypothetical protein
VALARAVYARTKYVLLDEPLSAVVSPSLYPGVAARRLSFAFAGWPYRPILIRTLAGLLLVSLGRVRFQSVIRVPWILMIIA